MKKEHRIACRGNGKELELLLEILLDWQYSKCIASNKEKCHREFIICHPLSGIKAYSNANITLESLFSRGRS
jgi:hypothetical protein